MLSFPGKRYGFEFKVADYQIHADCSPGADAGVSEHGDGGFGDHRHIDDDLVALGHLQAVEDTGEAGYQILEQRAGCGFEIFFDTGPYGIIPNREDVDPHLVLWNFGVADQHPREGVLGASLIIFPTRIPQD